MAFGVALAVIASVDAARHLSSYREEPGRRFEQVSLGRGSTVLLTPAIAVTPAGIFCQVIGDARYVLLWMHGGGSEQLVYDGEAFHPAAVPMRWGGEFRIGESWAVASDAVRSGFANCARCIHR